MATYTAHITGNSVGASTIHTLKATAEAAAKREARKLLGDGYRGQKIRLCEVVQGQRLEIAVATIGEAGWHQVQ